MASGFFSLFNRQIQDNRQALERALFRSFFCFLALFGVNSMVFSMDQAGPVEVREPNFRSGQEAVASGLDPVQCGYRQLSTFQFPLVKPGQKVLVSRSDGRRIFAQVQDITQDNHTVKVLWREQPRENKFKIIAKEALYVHDSWNRCEGGNSFLPNFWQGMRHYDWLLEWVENMALLSPDASSILDEDYYWCFCDEMQKKILRGLQPDVARWHGINIFQGLTSLEGRGFERCYIQKLYIHQGDAVFFFGDFHGDAASLIRGLQNLMRTRHVRDDFTLAPNTYLVFLGDYVDRGPGSSELLYLLLTLKNKNPDHVILLRGNHEDRDICEAYGFGRELVQKFDFSDPADRGHIYGLFDLLPVALYLGSQEGTGYTWTLCCHAGLEIGVNPREFLESDAQYMWLDTIRRNFHINRLPDTVRQLVQSTHRLPRMTTFAAGKKRSAQEAREKSGAGSAAAGSSVVTAQPSYNEKGLQDIGFLWNDFIFDGPGEFLYNELRGCQIGQRLTEALMIRDGISRIVRGHQHNGALLDQLYQAGYVSSFDGRVYTLMSGNVYPQRQELNYAYAHFFYEPQTPRRQAGWYMHSVFDRMPVAADQNTQPFEDDQTAGAEPKHKEKRNRSEKEKK
jgi:hypothetical protein